MNLRSDLVKETNRLIREARSRWDAHENAACRRMRDEAMTLYESLDSREKELIPGQLRNWLRYRSEKYFGESRTAPGTKGKNISGRPKKMAHSPGHAVFSRQINSPVGRLVILASKGGIAGLYFGHRIEKSTLPPGREKDRILNQAEKELGEYFSGQRKEFRVGLDVRGSSFQRSVWRELSRIPYGKTLSYGELAQNLGNPGAVRAVGAANGANPVSIIVPCHRVIGKDGSLTGFGGGVDLKRKLLVHEGICLKTREGD